MRNLAIVPARAGSKRIPSKNTAPVAGRPLLGWALEVAVGSGLYDEVHVSTDTEEIAAIGRTWGASVPFLRPASLATDTTPLLPVLRWVVEEYERAGERFDSVSFLAATAALVSEEDLRASLELFASSGGDAPVLGVTPYPVPTAWALHLVDGHLSAVDPPSLQVRSQDLPTSYYDAGMLSLFSRSHLDLPEPPPFRALVLPRSRAVDVDEPEDLVLVEQLLRGRVAATRTEV